MSTANADDWLTHRASASRSPAASFDVLAERAAGVGVAVLIVTGFVSSYTTLRDLAVEVGQFPGWLAPVVPLSFDVGIVVLSLKVLLAARAGRTAPVLRALVLILSIATVLANGASSPHLVGRLLHAVPSAMFVVCFETVVTAARRQALRERGSDATDARFRPVRWALAPRQTWTTWRTSVLTDPAEPAPAVARPEPTPLPAAEAALPRPLPQPTAPEHPSRPRPSTSGKADRLSVAAAIVRDQPDVTAAALAQALDAAGFPVSVRTAQRIRQEAREQLAVPDEAATP
ncbi:DUF2637 domain-containing protein [Paenibacillus sp. TRM 82003]|uniref:DUF2637 domain-containing protein n=1 Tax=Kineococcus sp. TRM81007 TaxID=2925831 RepID=UPI001F5925A0|nr:DUF2637 domain-containing protein [Kineococcus sp. TRM81007]MCI2238119.1 DUF2637 domain-containing protein [Kineococcus sp. TRM81007]MCI3920503.1 DUF2637 domain-containing protein [Paenibacillus sp. TRM 82003]